MIPKEQQPELNHCFASQEDKANRQRTDHAWTMYIKHIDINKGKAM